MSIQPPDMTWVNRARDGDRAALGAALEACRPALLVALRQQDDALARPTRDIEPIVSEGFRKAIEAFERFRGRSWGEWYTWVKRICVNGFIDEQRRASRAPCIHNFADLIPHDNDADPAFVDRRRGVSSDYQRREMVERIKTLVPTLPNAERLVFALYYFDDLSIDEIALLVGRSYDAVRVARARAVAAVRAGLGGSYAER